jgi:hypothetical protein
MWSKALGRDYTRQAHTEGSIEYGGDRRKQRARIFLTEKQ